MPPFVLVGLAGAAGAVARYGVGVFAHRWMGDSFAYGTLLVNIVGCLALGLLLEVERTTSLVSPTIRLLLGVGFLGAFTTFSTFGYETIRYVQDGTYSLALLNVGANLLLGLAAVWIGFWLSKTI